MTIQSVLQKAQHQLNAVETKLLDAEVLLSFVLKKTRSFLHAHPEAMLSNDDLKIFQHLINRRLDGEPIAYIIGKKEFWSLELLVNRDTLIPRPETELLVEFALKKLDATKKLKLADLGTGAGSISIALASERPNWEIYATDISQASLLIASKNAQRFKLNNITFCQGNWCTALNDLKFDMILSNPPYIAETEWDQYSGLSYEPNHALLGGRDGLSDIRIICKTAKSNLKLNGFLIIEHGCRQGISVREIFKESGYSNIQTYFDFSSHERFTVGQVLFS